LLSGAVRGASNAILQVAYLYAFDFDFKLKWKNWDWGSAVVNKQFGDTRAVRLKLGPNGNLYVLGQAMGGKTIFRWGPRDVNTLGTEQLVTLTMLA
jgi:hypothetical protein